MRYLEIHEARYPRHPSDELLAKAKQDGFDGSKLWFHGTRKRFDGFRLPKENGIDELGSGVYLTSVKWLANTWARDGGFIVICVVREGPMFDFNSNMNDPKLVEQLRKGFIDFNLTKWPSPVPNDNYPTELSEYFDSEWKRKQQSRSFINLCLSNAGYVGGFKRDSQIQGQIVVFKPEDVMIVARHGGKDHWPTSE